MDKDVIADIKQVGIEHRAAWDVMEQAAREFPQAKESEEIVLNLFYFSCG